MTVRELRLLLDRLPQDATVIYWCCSDYATMDLEQIKAQTSTDPLRRGMAVAHHNRPGEFRCYGGEREHKGLPPPTPADVVIFPGN